jgi:hypothetical protein
MLRIQPTLRLTDAPPMAIEWECGAIAAFECSRLTARA